jgi:hypothetical protein
VVYFSLMLSISPPGEVYSRVVLSAVTYTVDCELQYNQTGWP